MTYAKYTGRGLGWAKKAIRKREAKRIATFWAGLIIDAALNDGWEPDVLLDHYGKEGVAIIADHLMDVADRLKATGSHDGSPSR